MVHKINTITNTQLLLISCIKDFAKHFSVVCFLVAMVTHTEYPSIPNNFTINHWSAIQTYNNAFEVRIFTLNTGSSPRLYNIKSSTPLIMLFSSAGSPHDETSNLAMTKLGSQHHTLVHINRASCPFYSTITSCMMKKQLVS